MELKWQKGSVEGVWFLLHGYGVCACIGGTLMPDPLGKTWALIYEDTIYISYDNLDQAKEDLFTFFSEYLGQS